jgi:hypothetical protein
MPSANYTLYVNSFSDVRTGWERFGASPYLHNTDADYIRQSGATGDKIGDFGFGNLPQTIGEIYSCWLYMECYQEGAGETIDVYISTDGGSTWNLVGTITPNAGSYGWETLDITAYLGTHAKINNALMYLDYNATGAPSYVYVRRAYLKVRIDPTGCWIDHLPVEVTYSLLAEVKTRYSDGFVCVSG